MKKYYYSNHRLLRYYCRLYNHYFKTREEYVEYCNENNIELKKTSYFKKSKYSLEWDSTLQGSGVAELLAPGTKVIDARDISNYYFEDEKDAMRFLDVFNVNPGAFCLVCFYDGYYGEPDLSPEGLAQKYIDEYEKVKDTIIWDEEKAWKNVAHFIISYLPDYKEGEDNSLRDIRIEAHRNQIKSIKMTTPNAKIHIVAQNYRKEDYIDDPQIIYHKHPKLGAMRARNEALKLLYNSDYTFGIISDDDAFMAPTQSAIDFYQEVEDNPEKFNKVDIVHPRDIYHNPSSLRDYKDDNPNNRNWIFTWTSCGLIHWALWRNFKKCNGVEEYQSLDIDPTKGMGADDLEFEMNLFTKGYKLFHLNSLQLITLNCFLTSTVVYKEVKDNPWTRWNNLENTRKRFYKEIQPGWYDIDEFRRRYKHPSYISIPRKKPVNIINEYHDKNSNILQSRYFRLKKGE